MALHQKKKILSERFLRQYSVDHYVVDFYCPRLRLAVEIDGASHFTDNKRIKDDAKRQEYLESFGIEFLRFKNEEVYQNLDAVIDKITDRVRQLQLKQ